MAYNPSDQSISDPVSIYDVQKCLGISQGDLGTLITNAANINKWAKFKPVRWPNINTVGGWDAANHKWGSGATWWKADGLCGFATTVATEFGEPTSSVSFAYKLINGQLGWTYQKPTGGASQPFRLIDFAQYYHQAISPYGEIGNTVIYIDNNGNAQIDWDVVPVESRNLALSDINISINGSTYPLTDFYLGLILYSGSTYYLFTSSDTFATGQSLSVVMNNVASLAGNWNVMPFFTKNPTNAQGKFDPGIFVPMAETTPISIRLTRDGVNKFEMPEGEWNQANNAVNYTIYVVNETSTAHQYTKIRVTIYGGSYYGDELGHADINNVTINAYTTQSFSGSITGLNKSGYNSYWIVVSDLTSGSTIQSKYSQVEDYSGM